MNVVGEWVVSLLEWDIKAVGVASNIAGSMSSKSLCV